MMRHKLKIIIVLTAVLLFIGSLSSAEIIKIIAEDDWYPYSGEVEEGVVKGIAVDIVREAFKAEGVDVKFDIMNYDRGMLMVKDGKALGCFDTPRTKEIENVYYWHEGPLFSGDSYFYARSGSQGTVSSIADLKGKKLGLTQGYGYGNAIDLNNNIDKEYSKTDEIILRKLMAGRLDYIVLYDKVADYLILKNNVQGKVKPVGPSESTDLYLAFSKKAADGKKYCDVFSAGLRKIKDNGTYAKIIDDWNTKLKKMCRRIK